MQQPLEEVEISAEASEVLSALEQATGRTRSALASAAILALAVDKAADPGGSGHTGALHDALADILARGDSDVRAMVEKYIAFFQAHVMNA